MNQPVFKTIMVGDNGSPEAERAVDVAIDLARNLRAKLIIIGVLVPPSAESQAEGYGLEDITRARAELEEKFARLSALGETYGISIATEIAKGDPEETIERRAEEEFVELIVVGHRDITRMRRWLEGSTSETLVRKSKISVLVVRDGEV